MNKTIVILGFVSAGGVGCIVTCAGILFYVASAGHEELVSKGSYNHQYVGMMAHQGTHRKIDSIWCYRTPSGEFPTIYIRSKSGGPILLATLLEEDVYELWPNATMNDFSGSRGSKKVFNASAGHFVFRNGQIDSFSTQMELGGRDLEVGPESDGDFCSFPMEVDEFHRLFGTPSIITFSPRFPY